MHKKIIIAGDSWAFRSIDMVNLPGEMGLKDTFGDYLERWGYEVKVVAKPGYSNIDALAALEVELMTGPKYDVVIWIQTNPARDFRFPQDAGKTDNARLHAAVVQYGDITLAMNEHLMAVTYSKLNFITREVPVVLAMGGCSKIYRKIHALDHIETLIPSIPELLIPGHEDHVLNDCDGWWGRGYGDRVLGTPLFDDWMHVTKIMMDKKAGWQNDNMFFKPDNHHPNDKGHLLIAGIIMNRLRELNVIAG